MMTVNVGDMSDRGSQAARPDPTADPPGQDEGALAFVTANPDRPRARLDLLKDMTAQTGKSPQTFAREFTKLAVGPGKLTFEDYVDMRLFDDAYVAGADKSQFLGRRRMSEIVADINFDRDYFALAENKIAGASYLRAFGFPAAPPAAQIYVRGITYRSETTSGDPRMFADRLRNEVTYPVFGKPLDGERSFGSVVLDRAPEGGGLLTTSQGLRLTPEAFAEQVDRAYPRGYLLQPVLRPAGEIARITGGGLATVRVITAIDGGRARVLRACLKLPAPGNIADNYWRQGNVLARIDMATGKLTAATMGAGLSLVDLDLATAMDGRVADFTLPCWTEALEVVTQAQELIRDLPLIGWDLGLTDTGPVIVEVNARPSGLLNQLADRRGMLDPDIIRIAQHAKAVKKTTVAKYRRDFKNFALHRDFAQ